MGSNAFWIVLTIGVLLAIVLKRRAQAPMRVGRARWFVARALLPSWRFFEEIGHVPRLHYRVDNGDWRAVSVVSRRKWHHLFFNPYGNFGLALHGLMEQMLEEANEGQTEALDTSVSYRLLERCVRAKLGEPNAQSFQFKIAVVSQKPGEETWSEDVLISREHEV